MTSGAQLSSPSPERELTLRRRRGRVPWIYAVYHADPDGQPSWRRRNAGTSSADASTPPTPLSGRPTSPALPWDP